MHGTVRPINISFPARSSAARWLSTLRSDTRTINRTGLSARTSSSSSPSPQLPSRTPQALTLLHKTRSFLPRALGHDKSLDFWDRTLAEASDDLSAEVTAETKVRIVGECSNLQLCHNTSSCELFRVISIRR
jgi:hypothetical protein